MRGPHPQCHCATSDSPPLHSPSTSLNPTAVNTKLSHSSSNDTHTNTMAAVLIPALALVKQTKFDADALNVLVNKEAGIAGEFRCFCRVRFMKDLF